MPQGALTMRFSARWQSLAASSGATVRSSSPHNAWQTATSRAAEELTPAPAGTVEPMKFGILFVSHPDTTAEPYPHRDVHARVTREVKEADRLGYDTAWIAEHHFSNAYGILPDPFAYIAYLAPQTERIKLGTAVMTLPLHNPLRIVENAAFVDILTNGRFIMGLGSGYRPYEFEGFGVNFETRHDKQEEALSVVLEALHTRKIRHDGVYYRHDVTGDYEIFP